MWDAISNWLDNGYHFDIAAIGFGVLVVGFFVIALAPFMLSSAQSQEEERENYDLFFLPVDQEEER